MYELSLGLTDRTSSIPFYEEVQKILKKYYELYPVENTDDYGLLNDTFYVINELFDVVGLKYPREDRILIANYIYKLKGSVYSIWELCKFCLIDVENITYSYNLRNNNIISSDNIYTDEDTPLIISYPTEIKGKDSSNAKIKFELSKIFEKPYYLKSESSTSYSENTSFTETPEWAVGERKVETEVDAISNSYDSKTTSGNLIETSIDTFYTRKNDECKIKTVTTTTTTYAKTDVISNPTASGYLLDVNATRESLISESNGDFVKTKITEYYKTAGSVENRYIVTEVTRFTAATSTSTTEKNVKYIDVSTVTMEIPVEIEVFNEELKSAYINKYVEKTTFSSLFANLYDEETTDSVEEYDESHYIKYTTQKKYNRNYSETIIKTKDANGETTSTSSAYTSSDDVTTYSRSYIYIKPTTFDVITGIQHVSGDAYSFSLSDISKLYTVKKISNNTTYTPSSTEKSMLDELFKVELVETDSAKSVKISINEDVSNSRLDLFKTCNVVSQSSSVSKNTTLQKTKTKTQLEISGTNLSSQKINEFLNEKRNYIDNRTLTVDLYGLHVLDYTHFKNIFQEVVRDLLLVTSTNSQNDDSVILDVKLVNYNIEAKVGIVNTHEVRQISNTIPTEYVAEGKTIWKLQY